MNITVRRKSLHPVLQSVAKVIEDKPSAATIYSHVLLEAEDSSLRLTGTGPELEISGEVDSEVLEKGRITVPARKLSVICQHLEEDQGFSLALHENQVCVKARKDEYFLNTLSADDFPIPEEEGLHAEYQVQQSDLRELLERTHQCMAQDDVRQYLNGLLLEFRGSILRGVATDSHRLAFCEVPLGERKTVAEAKAEAGEDAGEVTEDGNSGDGESEVDVSIILPRRAVTELMRLLHGKGEATLKLMRGKVRVLLDEQKISFGSRLIDGRFPDYQRVIPKSWEQELTVDCKRMMVALSQVISFIQDRYSCIHLTMEAKQLQVHASSPENERLNLIVPAEFTADSMEISFNAQYLHKLLDTMSSAKAHFYLNGAENSCLVRPHWEKTEKAPASGEEEKPGGEQEEKAEEPRRNEYKFVVMPMRT